ncbi:MAG: DUF5606 domain-containing protein [Hyphomicrobiales bacterium]
MKLSKILAIAGRPGLYKLLGNTKNGLLVESILEGRKFPVFSTERISSLEEISIFTEEEDLPLKEVFVAIKEKCNGEQAISHKASKGELLSFIEEVIPTYDKDRVYISDIKKMIQWYNILQTNDLLDFEDEDSEVENNDTVEETSNE